MTPAQFAKTIALVESRDDPEAWGDGGRAMGRYQVHPDWLWGWALAYKLEPILDETWNSFVWRVLIAYYAAHEQSWTPLAIAMRFHLGHTSEPGKSDWDQEYADRFTRFAAQVVGPVPPAA